MPRSIAEQKEEELRLDRTTPRMLGQEDTLAAIKDISRDISKDMSAVVKFRNLIRNGSFERWITEDLVNPNDTEEPADWHIPSSIAVTNSKEQTTKVFGNYSYKMSYNIAAHVTAYQEYPLPQDLAGKKITFSCWIKTDLADAVYIRIVDYPRVYLSDKHPGDGKWHRLSVTTSDPIQGSDYIRFELYTEGDGNPRDFYFDGAMATEGETTIDYIPEITDERIVIAISALGDALKGASSKDFTTLESELDKKPDEATTPNELTVTLTNANTEYSQTLPDGTKALEFWARESVDIRFAFTSGKVATPTEPYFTLKAGTTYYKENINLTGKTLYLASSVAGSHVEIIAWT